MVVECARKMVKNKCGNLMLGHGILLHENNKMTSFNLLEAGTDFTSTVDNRVTFWLDATQNLIKHFVVFPVTAQQKLKQRNVRCRLVSSSTLVSMETVPDRPFRCVFGKKE